MLGAQLIDALFDSLSARAAAERDRTSRLNLHESTAKRNLRETYLDSTKRLEWEQRAQSFLARREDIACALSTETLYSAIAMQHYLDLDAVDVHLSPDLRRSEDSYRGGISQQFLVDATRAFYSVAGEVFRFGTGEAHETETEFLRRLVSRLRLFTPEALLASVTNAMSQSGLAALERASLCSAAVSGGSQEVEYRHQVDPENKECVLVTVQVCKKGFREYILASSEDPAPVSCDAGSFVRKAATIVFCINGDIDVVNLTEEIEISLDGKMLSLLDLCDKIPISFTSLQDSSVPQSAWKLPFIAQRCLRRACCCRRRLRP